MITVVNCSGTLCTKEEYLPLSLLGDYATDGWLAQQISDAVRDILMHAEVGDRYLKGCCPDFYTGAKQLTDEVCAELKRDKPVWGSGFSPSTTRTYWDNQTFRQYYLSNPKFRASVLRYILGRVLDRIEAKYPGSIPPGYREELLNADLTMAPFHFPENQ